MRLRFLGEVLGYGGLIVSPAVDKCLVFDKRRAHEVMRLSCTSRRPAHANMVFMHRSFQLTHLCPFVFLAAFQIDLTTVDLDFCMFVQPIFAIRTVGVLVDGRKEGLKMFGLFSLLQQLRIGLCLNLISSVVLSSPLSACRPSTSLRASMRSNRSSSKTTSPSKPTLCASSPM